VTKLSQIGDNRFTVVAVPLMIIGEPNAFVAEVHDRMPILLKPDEFDHWLSGNMNVEELKSAPNDYLRR
jgi:putative SOS response-associated peptidase YedK